METAADKPNTPSLLPWWTWLLPLFIANAGTWLSIWFQVPPGISLWYVPTAFGIVMAYWWGPRVLVGIYLNAVICTPLWNLPWHLSPLYALPETLTVALSWLLYIKIAGQDGRLTSLIKFFKFIILGGIIPALTVNIYLIGQLIILGNIPAGNMWHDYVVLCSSDLASHLVISIPLLAFLTDKLASRQLTRPISPSQVKTFPTTFPYSALPILAISIIAICLIIIKINYIHAIFFVGIIVITLALVYGFKLSVATIAFATLALLILPALGPTHSSEILIFNLNIILLGLISLFTGRIISDLKGHIALSDHVENKLRASQGLLQEAQRIGHIGNWQWDIPTGSLHWSDEVYRIFELEPQAIEATYDYFIQTVHEDDRQAVETAVDDCIKTNIPYSIDHRIICHNGIERFVHEEGEVIRDESGTPTTMFGTIQDITKQKQVELELKQYQNHLSDLVEQKTRELHDAKETIAEEKNITDLIIDSLPELFYLIDESGNYIRYNHNNLLATGYTAEEINTMQPTDFADKELVKEKFNEVLTTGKTKFEAELITKEGQKIPYLFTARRITIDGKPYVCGTGVDITERKKAEEEIFKLSRVVNQSPNVIIITDKEGYIEYANPALFTKTGFSPEQAIGQKPNIMKSEKMPDSTYEEMWQTILAGKVWRGELINKKKNGELWWDILTVAPIKDQTDTITHFLGIQEDITAQKKLEEQLKMAKETAEKNARVKSDFLANITHELRTPMNAVIGFIDLALHQETISTKTRDYLNTALNSAKSLLEIINDILDINRLESGKLVLEKTTFYLPTFLIDTLQPFSQLASQKGLALTLQYSKSIEHCLESDATRLKQVITNIVDNAIKFTAKGSIKVSVYETENNYLQFAISDTGIGISLEHQKVIFKPFSQADQSIARRFGGTGLGTAISQQLIRLLGGWIWVESQPDTGTTFNFTIPRNYPVCKDTCNPDCSIYGANNTLSLPTTSMRHFEILVADDSEINLTMATICLSDLGHHISAAHDGKEAVDLFSKHQFDAVLLDVQMPVMSGIEAAKKIRAMCQHNEIHIPIIAMSAAFTERDREDSSQQEFDDIIQKPTSYNNLTDLLDRLIPPAGGQEIKVIDFTSPASTPPASTHSYPGIDYDNGLKNWQNAKAYSNALKRFADKNSNITMLVEHHLANSNFKDAYQSIHKLAGTAGNLSLSDLHQQATALAKALAAESARETDELLPEFTHSLQTAVASIQHLVNTPHEPASTDQEQSFDQREINVRIDKVLLLFSRGELDEKGVHSLILSLRHHVSSELLNTLELALENYNFDTAYEILESIKTIFNDR